MKSFLDKIFLRSNNLDNIYQNILALSKKTPVERIFNAINSFSKDSEIRYVGGCIRKIINKEKVDDIDLATNLEPNQVCKALDSNKINYVETGIEHGTITALIDDYKFEITSLRKDVSTDGRHAKVNFSKDWKEDASRRDLTINSIYSDIYGNIFDPYNGKNDLENGIVNFIGDPEMRIKEDYLRILRYLRFFLKYSKQPHSLELIKKLKMNIGGISILSKERLLDELKKMMKLDILEKLSKDKLSSELILMIFPELKNISIFSKLSEVQKHLLSKNDFVFLLSLLIINENDNADYFLYRFNVSKKIQKRIKIIDNFYKEKITIKTFTEKKMNKVFYYYGTQAVMDILYYRIIKLRKHDEQLIKLIEIYKKMEIPTLPINASILMNKYQIPEGKQLGLKLKLIEKEWVENKFNISEKQIENIVSN